MPRTRVPLFLRFSTITVGLPASLLLILLPVHAQSSGRDVYMSTCIACHGPDGQGALPGVPDFSDGKWPAGTDDATLLKRVRDGFQSAGSPLAMPPRGGNPALTDDELKAVLDYMKRTFAR